MSHQLHKAVEDSQLGNKELLRSRGCLGLRTPKVAAARHKRRQGSREEAGRRQGERQARLRPGLQTGMEMEEDSLIGKVLYSTKEKETEL